jgi:hypothetical protein
MQVLKAQVVALALEAEEVEEQEVHLLRLHL